MDKYIEQAWNKVEGKERDSVSGHYNVTFQFGSKGNKTATRIHMILLKFGIEKSRLSSITIISSK